MSRVLSEDAKHTQGCSERMIQMQLFNIHIPISSVLLICILFHIIADFNLQGILANFKQRKWWKENYPQKLYKRDWMISLALHSLSWSTLTFLPFCTDEHFFPVVIAQAVIHFVIDHLKANKLCISLMEDQVWHLIQIVATVVWFCI